MQPAIAIPSLILIAVLDRIFEEHVGMTMWELLNTKPRGCAVAAWVTVGLFLVFGLALQAGGGSFWAGAFCGTPFLLIALVLSLFASVRGRQERRKVERATASVQARLPQPPQRQQQMMPPQTSQGSDSMDF